MLREGMFIANRYEILEKIGSGGMADVYRAKCHKLNRFVAVKVLKPEYCEDKTFVAKFRAEAQAAAGLMHSNIVNVYDVGEENGIYYIIMELVEGITLKKYIEKKGKLGVREAVSIAIQVAQGIEAAHSHHIVHRDIKPQNIIISKEGKVKVTDFGIARAASGNTINSAVMGSVHYISPEQARGGYSDEKSDVYSFGIMLFEMLTGRLPFEGDTTVAVALQHIQDDMVSPRKYLPDIPVSVEKIVLKCTQKKPDRRYQNMTDLIADLKRSLVTPNEDFVVISSAIVPGGPTQLIGEEDLAEITQKASKKAVGPSVIDPNHDDTDQYDETVEADEDGKEEITEDAGGSAGEPEPEDELEEDAAASKKIDRVITILGIAVGVIILVITIIVIVKMARMFGNNKKPSSTSPAQTVATDNSKEVEVPNLLGYTYDEAKKKLAELGLGINERQESSDLYEAGLIFKQSIDAGQMVAKNTTVIVYISKGATSFAMPNVIGYEQSSADVELRNKNLDVTYQFEETTEESLKGIVKSTDPEPGTTVKSGDKVTVVVYNLATQQTEIVPDVKGETRENAISILNAAGFNEIDCNYEYSDTVDKGKVISQSGATPGQEAPTEGTKIVLVVSNGPEATTEAVTEPEETEGVTEAPTEAETDAPADIFRLSASVDSSVIESAIQNPAEGTGVTLVFYYSYTDTAGNTVKTGQVSSRTLTTYSEVTEKGPYEVDVKECSGVDTSRPAIVIIDVTYNQKNGDEPVSNVTRTVTADAVIN
ncbi:MAG: Stk1 family PASTA domain-containing Ser/Thr kinase [Butyrivibrio sp.]